MNKNSNIWIYFALALSFLFGGTLLCADMSSSGPANCLGRQLWDISKSTPLEQELNSILKGIFPNWDPAAKTMDQDLLFYLRDKISATTLSKQQKLIAGLKTSHAAPLDPPQVRGSMACFGSYCLDTKQISLNEEIMDTDYIRTTLVHEFTHLKNDIDQGVLGPLDRKFVPNSILRNERKAFSEQYEFIKKLDDGKDPVYVAKFKFDMNAHWLTLKNMKKPWHVEVLRDENQFLIEHLSNYTAANEMQNLLAYRNDVIAIVSVAGGVGTVYFLFGR